MIALVHRPSTGGLPSKRRRRSRLHSLREAYGGTAISIEEMESGVFQREVASRCQTSAA